MRFDQNANRSLNLLVLGMTNTDPEVKKHDHDIIRASIIFLHAALEDFLRGVGRIRLPSCDIDVWERIPLVSDKPSLEAKKLDLRDFARHRGKTIDEVLRASLDSYMSRRTFNSAAEVDGYLKWLKIETAGIQIYNKAIDGLMKRRHRIVHQADHVDDAALSPSPLSFADYVQCFIWSYFSRAFALGVQLQLVPAEERKLLAQSLEAIAATYAQHRGTMIDAIDRAEKMLGSEHEEVKRFNTESEALPPTLPIPPDVTSSTG